jgi:hypothetical protein
MKAENHKRKGKSDNFFSTASKLGYCQCHPANENYMTAIHIGRKMRVLFFIDKYGRPDPQSCTYCS